MNPYPGCYQPAEHFQVNSDLEYLAPYLGALMAQKPVASAIPPIFDETAGIEKNSPAEATMVRIMGMTE